MWHLLHAAALFMLMQTRVYSPACQGGTQWTFVVDADATPDAASWLARGDAPPLAPGAAVRSARAFMQRMACESADAWDVAQIALRRLEGPRPTWVYVITFTQTFRMSPGSRVGSALARQVEVPVLLSGIVPKLSAATPRK